MGKTEDGKDNNVDKVRDALHSSLAYGRNKSDSKSKTGISHGILEFITPKEVAQDMINCLWSAIKNEVDPSWVFVDIYCKSGVFLQSLRNILYFDSDWCSTERIASAREKYTNKLSEETNEIRRKQLLRKLELLNEAELNNISDCSNKEDWIFSHMLMGMCPTHDIAVACKINLYGFSWYDGIIAFDNNSLYSYEKQLLENGRISEYSVERLKSSGNYILSFYSYLKNLKENQGMTIDIVVGNPPYNSDAYLDFIFKARELNPDYMCMITPAKWQGKTDGKPKGSMTIDKNEEFRSLVVPHMSHIVFYPNSKELFDISEWGGISYFLLDKRNHKEKQIKTLCSKNNVLQSDFETHDETSLILYSHKILSVIGKVGTLGEGFKQSLYVKNTDHGETTIDGTLGFTRQTFVGEQERGEKLKQAGYVEVMQGEKVVGYKKIDDLFTTLNLDKYKCITSIIVSGSTNIDNDGFSRYFNAYSIKPYQVPKGSFPVLRYFNTLNECNCFVKYTKTKIFQFLFDLGCCGTTLTKEFFRFIPDPNDWTMIYEDRPIPGYTPDSKGVYIDKDGNKHCSLYVKYNLDESDINIIESLIKDRTSSNK